MHLELHLMPGHIIRRLHQISSSVFVERMQASGFNVTPVQFAVLAAIDKAPGLDQSTLGGLIAYDRATVGNVVERLETQGLIVRNVSSTDKRARSVALSRKGKILLQEVVPIVRRIQGECLAGLNAGDRLEFLRIAQKIVTLGNELSRSPLQDSGRASVQSTKIPGHQKNAALSACKRNGHNGACAAG